MNPCTQYSFYLKNTDENGISAISENFSFNFPGCQFSFQPVKFNSYSNISTNSPQKIDLELDTNLKMEITLPQNVIVQTYQISPIESNINPPEDYQIEGNLIVNTVYDSPNGKLLDNPNLEINFVLTDLTSEYEVYTYDTISQTWKKSDKCTVIEDSGIISCQQTSASEITALFKKASGKIEQSTQSSTLPPSISETESKSADTSNPQFILIISLTFLLFSTGIGAYAWHKTHRKIH